MRDYSKTGIPVVVDREVVVDVAIHAVVGDVDRDVVVVVDVIRDVVVVVVDIDRDVVVDSTGLLLCCRLQDKLEKQHLENMKVR